MYKNAKIRTKLLLAFGLIIVLSAGIICWLLTEMNGIAKNTQKLYQQPYAASDYTWSIRRNLIDIERVLYKLMNVSEAQQDKASASAKNTISTDTATITEALSALQSLYASDSEAAALIPQISSGIAEGNDILGQILDLILDQQDVQAKELLSQEFEPLFDSCNEKVLQLFALTQTDAGDFAENARTSASNAIIVGIIALAIGCAIAVLCAVVASHALIDPILQLRQAAEEMSRGNLKAVDAITYKSRDELGQLSDSLRVTMTNLSAYVDEISGVLLHLADGDLTVSRDAITDFLGDFKEIKQSLVTILKSFNSTLGDISQAARQVDVGSSQVSGAAQGLSDGATEQAASIEELTATVEQISAQIRENAEHAQSANDLTE